MINKLTIPLNGTNTDINIKGQSIIFLGANGSGKTRLGAWIELKGPQNEKVHRISAQKSLSFPNTITGITTIEKAEKDLWYGYSDNSNISYRMGNKWKSKPETHLLNDYSKLLNLLFSEYSKETSDYSEGRIGTKSKTKLHIIKDIWEKILPHRELIISGNTIDVKSRIGGTEQYNAEQMSDGERVMFYLIGQSITAPKDGIIIIDEPELHLHKSIQNLLWKEIESYRKDCLFVYFSHDIDFVTSKVESKKIWLKSYDGTNWDWEKYNHLDGIPNDLELEIIGSRQKVLFIEGKNGSLDIELYKNVFHNFLVKPVGSSNNVINYTKSFKENTSFTGMNFFGLVDRDRRTDREISGLKEKGIFTLEVAEIENIFIVPELLDIVSDSLELDKNEKREEIKNKAIYSLNSELEFQISLRTKEEIKFKLLTFDLETRSKILLEESFNLLKESINFEEIYNEEKELFDTIISEGNYFEILKFYNRKTLAGQISMVFGLQKNELQELIIRKLGNLSVKEAIINGIKIYIPEELIDEI